MKSSEAIPLYIVRFMRLDDYPDEEYNYIRKSDAETPPPPYAPVFFVFYFVCIVFLNVLIVHVMLLL